MKLFLLKENDDNDDDIKLLKDSVDKMDINNASNSLPLELPKEESPLLLEPFKVDGRNDLPIEWKTVPNHLID